MKKLGKVLLIILAALVLAFSLWALIMGSEPYWIDLRAQARRYGADPDLTQTEQGMRYEIGYFDRTAYVVFDENRQVVEADGIAPIHFDQKNMWGLRSYEAFVEAYGEPHYYIGNTEEAWLTDDGYVIVMWMAGEWYYPFPIQMSNLGGAVYMVDLLATVE